VLSRLDRRSEAGYTIIEAVITCVLTLIVSSTALAVIDRAYKHNDDIQQRAEGIAQARRGLDSTVRLLRSQACYDAVTPPITQANGSSVTFWASTYDRNGAEVKHKHQITLGTDGKLTDTDTVNGVAKTTILATKISQANATTPVFRFYKYDENSGAELPEPTQLLNATSPPYTVATDSASGLKIARILVTVKGNPPKRPADSPLATTLQDEVFVRLVDPGAGYEVSTGKYHPQVQCS
jgi:Tfp pilus assembly protein PilV